MIEKPSYTLEKKEIFKEFKTKEEGLSTHQAEQRLHSYGLNQIQVEKGPSAFKIFLEQFKSPLVWILIVALIVSIVLKEEADAVIIGVIIIANAILGFIQEYRAEKAILALQQLSAPIARVIRKGQQRRIESKYLVPGDIVILEEGDKVPADVRLLENFEVRVQEAALTGESVPVHKQLKALKKETPLAERSNMLYASTTIVHGRAKACVVATGMHSEVGKIAKLIHQSKRKETPLQKKLKKLGNYLSAIVVIIALVIFVSGIASGEAASAMFLTAIALAVAAIPEGLPAVITISLALGVQRMSKRHALIRKLPSVETLGSVSVICSDKTGTLTHNEMTVTQLWANGKTYTVSGRGYTPIGEFKNGKKNILLLKEISTLLKIGHLCNNAKLVQKGKKYDIIGDPTEGALLVAAKKANLSFEEQRINEIPFSSERKMMTTIHKVGKKEIAYSKGAPEVILERCSKILVNGTIKRLTREDKKIILQQNKLFAHEALRVLACAYAQDDSEKNMIFVGLQAMVDPPREEVKQAITDCHQAGIRVIMITGDQVITAKAIAKELGIKGQAIAGAELQKKNIDTIIKNTNIFARVNPEDKLTIVSTLKKQGYIVAMTGDGVNDAPALKKADIGVAMGKGGTDVAKEAGEMILTDDNFASIVGAVEIGRGIFNNIRKFVTYMLSSNLGEVLTIFFATLLRLPLPLTALQILWINLITDGLPATALSVDSHNKEIMKEKPRSAREQIISPGVRNSILFIGVSIGVITLVLFWLYLESSLAKAQTIAFTCLAVFEIVQLQLIRSQYGLKMFSNKWLIAAVIASLGLHLVAIYTPLSKIFGTVPLEFIDWGVIILGAGVLYLLNKGMLFVAALWKKKRTAKKSAKVAVPS